jgi:putative SOS response-associated peptidase YedK
MASIHNRMPVILPPDAYAQWLDPEARPAESLQHLLASYSADEMTAHPVSTLVNSPANDRVECVVPVNDL